MNMDGLQLKIFELAKVSATKEFCLELAAKKFGYTLEDIRGKDRHRRLVFARMAASILLVYKKCSLQEIGNVIGHSHCLVVHYLKTYQNFQDTNYKEFLTPFNEIRKEYENRNRY
jgi:chromosomal replication initiation ATPase DnaA